MLVPAVIFALRPMSCTLLRCKELSASCVGQYSGFTQGARVLMLHALKNNKMSSLQA